MRVEAMLWRGERRREMNKRDRHKSEVIERALLHGQLKNVSLRYGTAELHRYNEKPVPLRFDTKMDHKMIRLRNKYIEIEGRGVINKNDRWENIHVTDANDEPYGKKSFDLEAFRNNRNPKVFDPDNMITIEMTDEEWESFDRAIHESRN